MWGRRDQMKMSSDYKPPLLLKRFIQFFGVATIGIGVAMFSLENSFLSHPRVAQLELGRVVAYPFKGAVFYITPDEQFWIKLIYCSFTVCFFVMSGLIVYVLAKMGFPINGDRQL
jgi:hypothetical protein